MQDTVQDPAAIAAVQSALLNSIGTQFGILFSDGEADQFLTALERQGWTLYPLDDAIEAVEPQSSPDPRTEASVQVHLHVSPSDTEHQLRKSMAAVRAALNSS